LRSYLNDIAFIDCGVWMIILDLMNPVSGIEVFLAGGLILFVAYLLLNEKKRAKKIIMVAVVILIVVSLAVCVHKDTTRWDYPTEIRNRLSHAMSVPGAVVVSASNASFQSGITYEPRSFLPSIGGTGTIIFKCDSPLPCKITGGDLWINGDFSAKVYACCNSQNPPTCTVSIGETITSGC